MSSRSLLATKAWVVSVNMGYGHERAAHGLKDLAHGNIITANQYPGIPAEDQRLWQRTQTWYETISQLQPIPLIGQHLFGLMDRFQRIPNFYPRRDLSAPSLQGQATDRLIRHGLGKDLIQRLNKKNGRLPFISTFFIPAFAAEVHGYEGDIYCVVCDADVSRAWVAPDPKNSRIHYFAPNGRVVERLKLYGVPTERISLTGFPLPKNLVGGATGDIVKNDLRRRLYQLDPQHIFLDKYRTTLEQELGALPTSFPDHRPVTITFCVGGAGAQKRLGLDIAGSLKTAIFEHRIHLNLEVGVRKSIADFYLDGIQRLGMVTGLGHGLSLHCYDTRSDYFRHFAQTLRHTDILWTKPSELSFYTGLGLPIVIAPPIGSQEVFNKHWLETVNGGIPQLHPKNSHEWLFDWIASGGLARFAWNGYIEAPTHGAYRIETIITGQKTPLATLPLIV